MKLTNLNSKCLRSLTREETIDIMEKRQEAAVLRYMRQISQINEKWPLEDVWLLESSLLVTEPETVKRENFASLNNSQIARIMASEQRMLEWRLQRQMAVLQEIRGDACVE